MPVEMLEHHVRYVAQLVDLMNDHDVVVRALRGMPRLREEPIRDIARRIEQKLHRDAPPELRVARRVHLPHPAAAELANQLVLMNAYAGRERRLADDGHARGRGRG